jgi:hypothetical protein
MTLLEFKAFGTSKLHEKFLKLIRMGEGGIAPNKFGLPILADSFIAVNTNVPGQVHISLADPSGLPENVAIEVSFDVLADASSPLTLKSASLFDMGTSPIPTRIVNGRFTSILMKPAQTVLLQNYPNSFNPDTWIPFQLSKPADVTIRIYNVAGQLVRTLNLGRREAGYYISKDKAAYWDGRNEEGVQAASGVYFYQIKTDGFKSIRKMVLAK